IVCYQFGKAFSVIAAGIVKPCPLFYLHLAAVGEQAAEYAFIDIFAKLYSWFANLLNVILAICVQVAGVVQFGRAIYYNLKKSPVSSLAYIHIFRLKTQAVANTVSNYSFHIVRLHAHAAVELD